MNPFITKSPALRITFFSPAKVTVNVWNTTRYNEPYNEIPVITNTTQKPKLLIVISLDST